MDISFQNGPTTSDSRCGPPKGNRTRARFRYRDGTYPASPATYSPLRPGRDRQWAEDGAVPLVRRPGRRSWRRIVRREEAASPARSEPAGRRSTSHARTSLTPGASSWGGHGVGNRWWKDARRFATPGLPPAEGRTSPGGGRDQAQKLTDSPCATSTGRLDWNRTTDDDAAAWARPNLQHAANHFRPVGHRLKADAF